MSLQHEMERLGRILAYDRDLRVDVRGTRAYSVPGRVVIPNAETYAHLGSNAERMLHGLLDHECGHARHTDHGIMERARKKGGESLASIVNALEDGRVERLMGAEYVGCKQNLHRKNRWFWEDAKWQSNFATSDPWTAFCMASTLVVRNSVSIPEVEHARPEIADLLRAALAHGLDTFDRCRTSEDIYKLALALWERFRTPPPPPPPPPPPEDNDEDDESEDDEDESDGTPEKPADGDEPDEGDPDGDDSDEGDGEGDEGDEGDEPADPSGGSQGVAGGSQGAEPDEGTPEDSEGASGAPAGAGDEGDDEGAEPDTGDDSAGSAGDDGDESADDESAADDEGTSPTDGDEDGEEEGDATENGGRVDPYRAIRELRLDTWKKGESVVNPEEAIAKLMEDEYEKGGVYRVFSHEFDVERDFHARPSHEALAEHFDDEPEAIERDARIASAALTQAFEVALKARRERRPIGGNDEGEVDLDLLGEYAVGSAPVDTIYRQWIAEDDRDVTVAIMLDCSGSMGAGAEGRSRDFLARRVAHSLHLALATCSIEHEITGFTTVSSEDHDSHPWTADMPELRERFLAMRAALIEAHEHGVNPDLFAREFWRWDEGRRYAPGGLRGRAPHVSASAIDEVLKRWPLLVPTHVVFKPYGVSDARGLRYAHGIHENLDGEAVLWQARRLAARPEKRRVMFVLSDGMPSGARDNRLGAEFLKESVQRVIASGIEVYGIGIETDAVKHFYPRHWIANSVEHLMQVAFESFAQVITEGRTEVECVNL